MLATAIVLPTLVMAGFVIIAEWPTRTDVLVESAIVWGFLVPAVGGSAVLLHRSGVHPAFLWLFIPVQMCWLFFFALWVMCAAFGDCVAL